MDKLEEPIIIPKETLDKVIANEKPIEFFLMEYAYGDKRDRIE